MLLLSHVLTSSPDMTTALSQLSELLVDPLESLEILQMTTKLMLVYQSKNQRTQFVHVLVTYNTTMLLIILVVCLALHACTKLTTMACPEELFIYLIATTIIMTTLLMTHQPTK